MPKKTLIKEQQFITGLILFLLLPFFPTQATKIKGRIIDIETGKPVPNFTLSNKEKTRICFTDDRGHFELILPNKKEIKLIATHINYKTISVDLLKIPNDTFLVLTAISNWNELKTVDITAALPRQILTQSYSQTNIDETTIQEKIASSLIDVLEEVPGITKRGEYHSPIALRGLGGKRLLVTEDGNRRMGSFSGTFMGQGVNIYDLAKVEVIKGPASVKYGPGAITGIINLESKSPFIRQGWHGKLLTSLASNNGEKTILSTVNWAGMDHALNFSARWRDAGNYFAGLGSQTENSEYHDKDLHISYAWEGNRSVRIKLESELHLGGPWGRPVGFNGTNYMHVYNTNDDTWHNVLSIKWKPEKLIRSMDASVYFDKEYRQQIKDSYDVGSGKLSYREDVSYFDNYGGWRYSTILGISKKLELTTGTDGVLYRIQSPTENTDYFLSTNIKNRVSKDAGVMLAGVFAETEYKSLHEKLKLRVGFRADYSQINEGDVHDTTLTNGRISSLKAWNATAGAVYQMVSNIYSSFQIARSCRMPDASEMFMITSASDGIVYGNPQLTPEYGLNLDAGIRGFTNWISFDLSFFCNFLNDFISLEYWSNSGKKGMNYTYYNIDKARIFGGECSIGTKWKNFIERDNVLTYNLMLVYTRGDKLTDMPDWFSGGVPLRSIPPFNLTTDLTFRRLLTSSNSVYLGGDMRFYTAQYRIAPSADGGYPSPGYALFGASAGFAHKAYPVDWDIKLRGDNLSDNKYKPFESLVYGMGRNIKIMLTLNF